MVASVACFPMLALSSPQAVPQPYLIADLASPVGLVQLTNLDPELPITELTFRNPGNGNVIIDSIQITTADGQSIESDFGIGVQAGSAVSYVFSAKNPKNVESIRFIVQNETASLEVFGVNGSGTIPTGFSVGN